MDGTERRIFKPDRSRYYRKSTPQSYKEDKVDINSDHFLVRVKLKIQKWKKKTRNYRDMKQFDMEKLQLIDTQQEYIRK